MKGFCLVNGGGGIEANNESGTTLASFDCDLGLKSALPLPKDWANFQVMNNSLIEAES